MEYKDLKRGEEKEYDGDVVVWWWCGVEVMWWRG